MKMRFNATTASFRLAAAAGLCLAGQTQGQIVYGLISPSRPTAVSGTPSHLFRFQDTGAGFTDLGPVTLAGNQIDTDALAISSAGSLFGYQVVGANSGPYSSQLFSLNSATAVATPIGSPLTGRDIRGAMFDGANSLRVLDAAANALLTIDPASGAIIGAPIGLSLGANPYDLATGTDLATRLDGKTFLVDVGNVYLLDLLTGGLSLQTSSPGNQFVGAAFSTTDANALFVEQINGLFNDIQKFGTGSGFGLNTVVSGFLAGTIDAGRGDLAAQVPEVAAGPVGLFMGGLLAVFGVNRSRRSRQGTALAGS